MVFRKNTVGSAKIWLSIGFASWVLSSGILVTATSLENPMSKLERIISGVWQESNLGKSMTPRLRRSGAGDRKRVHPKKLEPKEIDVQYFKEENYERFLLYAGQSFSAITSPPSYSPSKSPSAKPTTSPTMRQTTDPDPSPTFRPTTAAPTLNPTTVAPVPSPITSSPTANPTTAAPTLNPTTLAPVPSPTTPPPTANPTTAVPTANPTTAAPTPNPTTAAPTPNPTTAAPTANPTTAAPTPNPTTIAPTPNPTTLSPTTLAPTRSPTPLPTNSPTWSPENSCAIDVEIFCKFPFLQAPDETIQIDCADVNQPPLSCTDTTDITLVYEEATCDDDASTSCTDYECNRGSTTLVTCTANGELFCNCTAEEGGLIVITSQVVLPDEMTCVVSNPDNGDICQEFSFDSSGDDVGLNLGDRFGSLTVSTCTSEGEPEQNCLAEVAYYYTVANVGSTDLEIVNFTRTCDGVPLYFTEITDGPVGVVIKEGISGYVIEKSTIDVCRNVNIDKGLFAEGVTYDDGTLLGPCSTEADLIIPVHPVAPTSAPVTPSPVTPAPVTPAPSPLPTTLAPTLPPTEAVPSNCDGLTVAERRNEILSLLEVISDPSLLSNSFTNQYKASQWLIEEDELQVCPSDVQVIEQRYIAALQYYSLNGDSWDFCNRAEANSGSPSPCSTVRWLSGDDACKWEGNDCYPISGSTKIIKLGPDENGASGSIPSEVTYLTELVDIDLDDNEGINGKIPENVGSISELVGFDVDNNLMTGTIPESIYDLPNLKYLDLDHNIFTGTLSTEIGRLDLLVLQLHNNAFTGQIPTEIGLLDSLTILTFDTNEFTGPIPSELNSAFDLEELTFGRNNMNGTLPTAFGEFRQLEFLQLSLNAFNGNIPTEYGQMTKLTSLNLNGNKLDGEIPTELGLLVQTTMMLFHANDFTGISVPQEICDLKIENGGNLGILTADCKGLNAPVICNCNCTCY